MEKSCTEEFAKTGFWSSRYFLFSWKVSYFAILVLVRTSNLLCFFFIAFTYSGLRLLFIMHFWPLKPFVINNFYLQQGKFNPQYMKGSPHSSQRGGSGKTRSQTPDHMLSSDHAGGVEMKPLHQVQTSLASNVQSPSVAQKVSRMGVPTPFAGATAAVPSPIR